MAGSLKRVPYISDDGKVYVINRDESNTETVNGTLPAFPSVVSALPDGYTARYALLASANGLIRRRVTILDPLVFAALDGADTFTMQVVNSTSGIAMRVSSLIGERRENLIFADTGQNDGDDP
jgi:hypothetical protein